MAATAEQLLALARVERGALLRLVQADIMRHNMPEFMRWAWHLDPSHSSPLIWNWHLDAICAHLAACRSGDIKRLIINVPPRTLKSWTVSVAFPAWVWASEPHVQFLSASADKDVALRDADALRDLCAHPEYQRAFRPKWDFRGGISNRQQDSKGYYRNSAGGHRISKAMGAKSQGANTDVLLFDDPLDATDAYSDKAALLQHIVHAKQKFMTRLNDQDTGVVILIMQRLHELDLAGVFLADGGWDHLFLPAEFDCNNKTTSIGWRDPRTEEGELLFPKRLSQEFLDQKKIDLGSRGYAGQYQQLPAPAAGAMILKKWLRYWTPADLPEMDYWIGSWDCSFGSKTAAADYVVGQVWGVAGSNQYLLDQVRRKMNVPEMLEAMRAMNTLYPHMRAIVVEERAAGKHVMETLSQELYGIEGFNPGGQSKEERLGATLPNWEQGNVHLPHPQLCSSVGKDYSWIESVYQPELLAFNNGRHDDQVDATSQALIWIRTNGPGGGVDLEILG